MNQRSIAEHYKKFNDSLIFNAICRCHIDVGTNFTHTASVINRFQFSSIYNRELWTWKRHRIRIHKKDTIDQRHSVHGYIKTLIDLWLTDGHLAEFSQCYVPATERRTVMSIGVPKIYECIFILSHSKVVILVIPFQSLKSPRIAYRLWSNKRLVIFNRCECTVLTLRLFASYRDIRRRRTFYPRTTIIVRSSEIEARERPPEVPVLVLR